MTAWAMETTEGSGEPRRVDLYKPVKMHDGSMRQFSPQLVADANLASDNATRQAARARLADFGVYPVVEDEDDPGPPGEQYNRIVSYELTGDEWIQVVTYEPWSQEQIDQVDEANRTEQAEALKPQALIDMQAILDSGSTSGVEKSLASAIKVILTADGYE